MQDPTNKEIAAMMNGGRTGGEYLDSIKKSDLSMLDENEWMTFIESVITGYCDFLAIGEDEVPF